MEIIEKILVEPQNKREFEFISEMLKRMNIKNRILSIEEIENDFLNFLPFENSDIAEEEIMQEIKEERKKRYAKN